MKTYNCGVTTNETHYTYVSIPQRAQTCWIWRAGLNRTGQHQTSLKLKHLYSLCVSLLLWHSQTPVYIEKKIWFNYNKGLWIFFGYFLWWWNRLCGTRFLCLFTRVMPLRGKWQKKRNVELCARLYEKTTVVTFSTIRWSAGWKI